MVRLLSYMLSFWLALLFIVGQLAHIPQLLVFFVGLAAVLAGLGAITAPLMSAGVRLGLSIALTIGLVAVSVVGLVMKVPLWLPACVLMGTGCFIGVIVAELIWAPRNRGTMAPADS